MMAYARLIAHQRAVYPCQLLSDGQSCFEVSAYRHDPVDQTDLRGLARVDTGQPEQNNFFGALHTDHPGEQHHYNTCTEA